MNKENKKMKNKSCEKTCATCKQFVKEEINKTKGKVVGLCLIQLTNPFAYHLLEKGIAPKRVLYFDADFGCKNHEVKNERI